MASLTLYLYRSARGCSASVPLGVLFRKGSGTSPVLASRVQLKRMLIAAFRSLRQRQPTRG